MHSYVYVDVALTTHTIAKLYDNRSNELEQSAGSVPRLICEWVCACNRVYFALCRISLAGNEADRSVSLTCVQNIADSPHLLTVFAAFVEQQTLVY